MQAAQHARPDNATIRSVFIIEPDKKVKASFVYPMNAGRSFDECRACSMRFS